MHNSTHNHPLGQNTETNAAIIARVMRGNVTTRFAPKPLPTIADRMSRGVSAKMSMHLYLLTMNRQAKTLAESRHETLQPF